MTELNNHLDSIQGRIDLFSNALQTMWMNFINADVVKFIVDIGTGLIQLVDKVGVLNTALAGLWAGHKIKKALKEKDVDILGYIFDIAPEKIKNDPGIKNFIPTVKAAYSEILNGVAKDTIWDGADIINVSDLLANLANFDDANDVMAEVVKVFDTETVTKQQAKEILDSFDVLSETTKSAILKTINEINAMDLMVELGGFDDTTGILGELQEAFGFEGDDLSSIFVSKDKVKEVLDGFDDISDATKEAILGSNLFAVSQTGAAAGTITLTGALASAKAALIAFGKGLMDFATVHPIIAGLTAAVIALGAAMAIIDATTTSHDEYIEKLEKETENLKSVQSELKSVQSELEKTNERMDELNAKDSLSFVETEELTRLKEVTAELERQEEILIAQEKRTRKKQIETALNAAEKDASTSRTDWLSVYSNAVASTTTGELGLNGLGIGYTDTVNEYEHSLTMLKKAKEDLEKAEIALSETTYNEESKEYKKLEKAVTDAQNRVDSYNSAIDRLDETWQTEYGEVGYIENATEEYEKQWNEFYRQHQDYLDQQALINNDYGKDVVLDRIFGATGTDIAQEFKKEFESAVNGGQDPAEAIEALLASADYSSAFTGLEKQFGITMDNIKAYFTQTGEFAIDPNFDITKYSSDIKSHSAVISEFQDAIMKLGKGSFTMDDFLDLVERFPDLAKGVDISSNAFHGLSRNLNKAIKTRTKSFIRDLQDLRKSMVSAGKATDSIDQLIEAIENMPDDALDDTIEKYSTLADAIERSRVAQDKLLASMEENPNQGYETRGEALEYMKDAMSKGEIGSESNLWNVAKQYGFTYDSAKSINENADALAKYIAVREKWWKQSDDGDDRTKDGYSFEGTENFIQSVEEAVNANARLQQILKWDYDETTGTLDFDFDNEDLPEIISLLSGMKDLVGLTQDEWMDLMVQVGQFFDIKWGDADDVSDYITKIAEGSGTAADKIDQMTDSVEVYVEKALGKDIDFSNLTEASIDALNCDESIKELLRTYLSLKESLDDPLNIETKIEESETIEPLLEIKELQDAIKKGSYNYTIVNTDTFASVLTAAGYTEDQINDLIKKIKEYQGVVTITNNDPLGLNSQNASATTVMSSLKQLGVECELIRGELGTPAQINITAKDLITTLQEKGWTQPKIAEYIATLTSTENGLGITVDGQVNMTTDQVDAAITEINNAPKDINTTVNVDYSQFTSYQDAFEAQNGRTITNTVYIDEIHREYDVKSGSYTTISGDGKVGVNGTAHAQGTAYNSGSWGAEATETSLVGELGPELLVRGNRWTTVGENGAEFTQVKKGDIIFNHKQTESLLKNGYVTGRGKAYASGTAFASGSGTFGRYEFSGDGGYVKYDVNDEIVDRFGNAADSISGAGDSLSDATDEFKEVFDWIEVRLEELEETLGLLNAQLENAAYYSQKNNIIDDIIAVNKTKLKNLNDGYAEYSRYAAELLSEIPEQYRDAAQNGAIAIEKFVGEADEKTLEAIQNYREWIQKAADLNQQAEEIITTIRDLAIQKFDNAYEAGDVRATVEDSQTEKLQNAVDYDEERGLITSDAYYLAMMENSNKKIEYLTEARKAMQAELNAAVEAGQIEKGSNEWYELLDQMYQIDAQIDEATIELEEFQNAINDIYWENFDQLINRIDYIKDETQNLIDLMDSEDMVVDPVKRTYEGGTVEYWIADDVEWSKEGLASLGLYAQQMEIAEYKAKQYAKAIDDLNKDYADGKYSENEYYEKLNELKDAQYESIEAYYDAQDAIKDLNQTRIDSIKKGIEKEIEAYEELIDKKKEALDADKDAHDFQKSIQESQKNIDDIQRKLDALYGDNSASARARRAQLEAELAKARQEQEELYYDRSIEDQQNALDKELENFQKEKDDEITKMEEYLEDIKQVVADSLTIVQDNASGIYDTLSEKAAEYDLTLSDAIMSPWQDGSLAVSGYQETFDTAMSSTMDQLEALKNKWQEVIDKMIEAGNVNVENINKENEDYAAATYTEPVTPPTSAETGTEQGQEQEIAIGSTIDAGDAPIYVDSNGGGKSTQYYKEHPIYKVVDLQGDYALVRHDSLVTGVTGWFRKNQIKAFAKGTKSADKDQWSIIDELGDELRLIPDGNGRLAYMKKGTGVVPADLTTNLMEWGKLDPTNMLEQNRPQIGVSPSVVNNTTEIHIDASVGELLHVEHLEGNNPVEISKIVDKAWDKRMKELNGYLRRYTNR